MTPTVQETLREIGKQLDRNIYPSVHNGGFVMPCAADVPETKGRGKTDERQRSRRSKTGSRDGTAGRQGPTGETPSLICTELQTQYETELDAVYEAYPKTRVWQQSNGLLLLTESALIKDLDRTAHFSRGNSIQQAIDCKRIGVLGRLCCRRRMDRPATYQFPRWIHLRL